MLKPTTQLPGAPDLGEEEFSPSRVSVLNQATDPGAADRLPHDDLGRGEALDLLQAVFGAQLSGPAGIFDDLHVKRFLSDNVAVISPGDRSGAGAALLESSLPLRAPGALGREEAVDLSLQADGADLEPANPLVDVGVPRNLDEGMSLPASGVEIGLEGAPAERGPSVVGSVAFYPNVAEDTDVAVAPTPTGLETFTQLRTAEAPLSQSFRLDLPAGFSLAPTGDGGAEAVAGNALLLSVLPPTALDARGEPVPVTLDVSGNSLTLHVSPDDSAAYPILVDPIVQTYSWYAENNSNGIFGTTNAEQWSPIGIGGHFSLQKQVNMLNPPSPLKYQMPGLYIQNSGSGTVSSGEEGSWVYHVPRYFSDYTKYGSRPTSYIERMTLQNLGYFSFTTQASPALRAGIWDETNKAFTSLLSVSANELPYEYGRAVLANFSYAYEFPNSGPWPGAKTARVGLVATASSPTVYRAAYVGSAVLKLTDVDNPSGSVTAPSKWVDATAGAGPIGFSASDTGLGVYSATVSDEQTPQHSWTTKPSPECTGDAAKPCPRNWASSESTLTYEPSVLPQGLIKLNVKIADPLGHSASAPVTVKVDHTGPSVTLSGTITEQASLGTKLNQYKLHVATADGTEGSPQSGVASVKISVDGTQVDSTSPGCGTQNCAVSRDWTLTTASYSPGQHTVEVIATDAVGRSTTKTLKIETGLEKDTKAPTLTSTTGSLLEAKGGWVSQSSTKTYSVQGTDSVSGVTLLELRIDGQAVKTLSQGCEAGACGAAISGEVSMSKYAVGAHTVETVARDLVGNTTTQQWTIRVYVIGTATPADVAKTSEALIKDSGAESSPSTIESFPYRPSLAGEEEPTLTIEPVGIWATGEFSFEEAKKPKLVAESYPAEVSGGQTAEHLPKWEFGAQVVNCKSAQYESQIPSATTEINVGATYGECSTTYSGYEMPVTVNTHGCTEVLHVLNAGPPYKGGPDVSCPNGVNGIEFRVFLTKQTQEENKAICVAEITPQTGLTGVGIGNVGEGSERGLSLESQVEGIKYTFVKSLFMCSTNTGSYSNGVFKGGATLHSVVKTEEVPAEEAEYGEEFDDYELVGGSGVEGTVSLDPGNGFSLAGASGLPFVMEPVGLSGEAPTAEIAGGDAIAYANIRSNTDMITRPSRNGMTNYVVFRTAEAVKPVAWQVSSVLPLELSKREDGGVNVVISPETAVPDTTISETPTEETEVLSEEPQVVASIAAPQVVDGTGAKVSASLSVSGDEVTLTTSPGGGAVYPLDAEVAVHLTGALQTWYPDPKNEEEPSAVPAEGVGLAPKGEAGPVAGEWLVNGPGTEVTALVPDASGEVNSATTAIVPKPGSTFETFVVKAPIEEFKPKENPVATSSCIFGFCAGHVSCTAAGPERPYFPDHGIQTYGLIACLLSGDLPPQYRYEVGGACLHRRFSIGGQPVWVTEKCHEIADPGPQWQTTKFVTKGCNSGVWRGEAVAVVVATTGNFRTGSTTARNTRCD